jgi:hypothetical protein
MEEMKPMIAYHEQGMKKCLAKCLTEQTSKYDEDLKALKQSQSATNNLLTTHNPLKKSMFSLM